MSGDRLRRAVAAALGMVLAASLLVLTVPAVAPAAAVPRAAAASGDTRVTGSTTYTLDPAGRAVHVSAAMTFEDTKPDSSTVRYYFTGYRLGIQKEAREVSVTSGGKALTTAISTATDPSTGSTYQVLDVTFAARVYHGQQASFRVSYDLPDSGPRSNGLIRVGPAVAAFYAWAYGADGAAVTIKLPAGFSPTVQGSALHQAQAADGSTTLTASGLSDPATWAAWITAERPDALSSVTVRVPIDGRPEAIEIRAFPEDQTWLEAVRSQLISALPVLGRLVRLPWPAAQGSLVVSEAYAPLLGGYAGLFRQADTAGQPDTITITEDPDPLVIVHEASHAWFNGDLFTGRWINEGLADEYASRALAELGQSGFDPERVLPDDPASFPLDAWPPPGPIDDPQAAAAERYGYNAAWTVIRSLVSEIGEDRMAEVLQAARSRTIAYVGRPSAETYARNGQAPDWHVLLDLLEQVGGSHSAEGLFRTWVVGPADQAQLAAHRAAIEAYAHLVSDGQGWLPGLVVRSPMAAWDFGLADRSMAAAEAVLAVRDRIATTAAAIGLHPTADLQQGYESATTSLATVQQLADEQLATLQAIDGAGSTVAAPRDVLTSLGLVGERPETALAAAGAAFEAGDLREAQQRAAAAASIVRAAPALGRQRLLEAGAALLGLVVLAGAAAMLVLRHRRGRVRAAGAAAATLPASLAVGRPGSRDGQAYRQPEGRDGPDPGNP